MPSSVCEPSLTRYTVILTVTLDIYAHLQIKNRLKMVKAAHWISWVSVWGCSHRFAVQLQRNLAVTLVTPPQAPGKLSLHPPHPPAVQTRGATFSCGRGGSLPTRGAQGHLLNLVSCWSNFFELFLGFQVFQWQGYLKS